MHDALYIAAIGLQAQKEQLDAVANNLANVGTTAFKRQSVDFSAILDRASPASGANTIDAGDIRPNRLLRFDATPGDVRQTGRPLDVAILGPGFFEVELPGDRVGYSRVGSLQVNADGVLALSTGQVLKSDVRVPADAHDVRVLADGSVTAVIPGDVKPTDTVAPTTVLGQIELAIFPNPESLTYQGDGVFTAPEGVDPTRARPGEEGSEALAVQSLEGSNINLTNEMVTMMLMQRIYELNSRVAQIADEMIGMSNNMRRN
jgi:flagellar basal-body rod protein FlgG